MGDAPGALGGAIPWDKALRDCCVSFPKRTILSSASVGIRAGDVNSLFPSFLININLTSIMQDRMCYLIVVVY